MPYTGRKMKTIRVISMRSPKRFMTLIIVFSAVMVVLVKVDSVGYIFSTAAVYFPTWDSYLAFVKVNMHQKISYTQENGNNLSTSKTNSYFSSGSLQNSMGIRKQHVEQYCRAHNNLISVGQIGVIYLYKPKQIAFCEVPKNGCTFWKRIIRFLNKDFLPMNISKPSDIPRHYTHLGPFKTTQIVKVSKKLADKNLKDMHNTFMFARDPYSRLWSAYLDKIFLPDFWTYGRMMVFAKRKNPTMLSLQCGHDTSFSEFLQYIISHSYVDRHFLPIHRVCNPCLMKFKYLGGLESFVDDAKYILNKTGISSITGDEIFDNVVENEIKSLTEDYLNLKKPWSNSECDNKTFICEKLWKAFQFNGYIGFNVMFPSILYKLTDKTKLQTEFISQALKAYQDGKRFHKIWRQQKRQSLVQAYRTLPRKVLQEFQRAYEIDFELFGYDKQPGDIFNELPAVEESPSTVSQM